MGRPPFVSFKLTFASIALLAGAIFTHPLWLSALGRALIHDDGPAKADLAVVLAGDFFGHRIEKAGDLVRAGYVPAALVSGPRGLYGFYESELEIRYAVSKGYPEESFISFPNNALSTREETKLLVPELRRRGVRSILLVTSDFHTGRALRLFRAAERELGGGPEVRAVAAPDQFFRAESWWRDRQAQKTFFFEWSKTLATAVGM